jgi:hypothetical protein
MELDFPADLISQQLANLLSLMLEKDQKSRITKGKTQQIKNHPWCK